MTPKIFSTPNRQTPSRTTPKTAKPRHTSPAKALRQVVAATLSRNRREFEAAIEATVARPDGTEILLDAYRELTDRNYDRDAKRLVYQASNRANEVTEVPGFPGFQALGFTIPFLCVSASVQEYAAAELPLKLTVDLSPIVQKAVGLPESVIVQIDPRVYRDSEFMGVGPSEARRYFRDASAAILGAEEVPSLETLETARGRCTGRGGKRSLDHAAYLLVGTAVLPTSERADLSTVLAVGRLRDTLLNSPQKMKPVLEAITDALEQVLPGTKKLTHVVTDDRLDLMGQIMSRIYSDMEAWQAKSS